MNNGDKMLQLNSFKEFLIIFLNLFLFTLYLDSVKRTLPIYKDGLNWCYNLECSWYWFISDKIKNHQESYFVLLLLLKEMLQLLLAKMTMVNDFDRFVVL